MRMYAVSLGLLLGSMALVVWSQSPATNADSFSSQEWAVVKTLSPLPALPVDTTNKYRDSAAAALLGQKLFFEPRLAGPIQAGTPAEGQLGAIGETGKIACRNCHMPESKWLFDIRSNNGGPIPNATALGSNWMTRNVSSIVNTVFYVHPRTGAHWREMVSPTPSGSTRKASLRARLCRMGRAYNSRTSSSSTTARNTIKRFPSGRSMRVSRTTIDFQPPVHHTPMLRIGTV